MVQLSGSIKVNHKQDKKLRTSSKSLQVHIIVSSNKLKLYTSFPFLRIWAKLLCFCDPHPNLSQKLNVPWKKNPDENIIKHLKFNKDSWNLYLLWHYTHYCSTGFVKFIPLNFFLWFFPLSILYPISHHISIFANIVLKSLQ